MKIYLIVSLGSIGLGAGSVILWQKMNKEDEPPIVVQDQVALSQQEIVKQLTDLDLLAIPCSENYLMEKDSTLCRELFCRMMTRGIDAQTGGQECENISNISNTQAMIETCNQFTEDREECYRLFQTRK